MMKISFATGINAVVSLAAMVVVGAMPAASQDHSHHQMTNAQFAELREKVPLYREYTDEQILENMGRMGPNHHVYLSAAGTSGNVGVLALGHGYEPSGNEAFKSAYVPTAEARPTAVAFGMAMMTSDHIQSAVDDLTNAGADTILVMPVTTLKVGGLIGQWRYIFGERDDAPWMSVPRVATDANVVFGPTPTTDPLISAILLDNATQLSDDPTNEVVALIAHGPDNEQANATELAILEQHAAFIRAGRPFVDVRGFTLQDDAPSAIRQANIDRIRTWVQSASDDDRRVIVLTTLPVKGSVHKKIKRDLDGLDYVLMDKGVVENPLFSDWINAVIATAGAAEAAPVSGADAVTAASEVVIEEATHHDLYAAGQKVSVEGAVDGDLVVAGGEVTVSGNISEDVIAAGGEVNVEGHVGDDARLAGGEVTVDGSIAGHVVAAGGEVEIEEDASIGEWAWLAGGEVEIEGTVGGDVRAAGGEIEISGTIRGDAELIGGSIAIEDGAVIDGDLTWRSNTEPVISDGAVIRGEVIAGPPLPDEHERDGIGWRIFVILSVIIATGVLYTLFWPRCEAAADVLRARPWATLLTGLVVFAVTPVVAALLFATGIGALLGAVTMSAYVLALLLGSLSGVALLARLGMDRFTGDKAASRWMEWVAIAVVAIVIGLLYVVRPIGMLAATLVMLFGLGAISREAYQRLVSDKVAARPASPT